MTSLVFVPSRLGCQVLRLRRLPLLREGGKYICEFQLLMPTTFCFPCRFIDINVILCYPLPHPDTLVITNGLTSDRIRLVATGTFTAVEVHASRATRAPQSRSQKCLWRCWALLSRRASVHRCYDLLFRHCFPDCSDDALLAMVQKMFEAPTQDELIEQELDPLMREALLAVWT